MNSYSLTPQAVCDLEEIHDFIASENLVAALHLIDLFEKKFQTIAHTPEMGRNRQELAPKLRSFPVGNYVIFYRPDKKGIQVIRVLHGARDIESIFE